MELTYGESAPLYFIIIRRYLLQVTRLPLELIERIILLLPGGLRVMAPRAITMHGGYSLRARPPTRDLSLIGKLQ